ncbi:MAG: helix-turn-helix transcriptional regulator [Phycicoccus sp.]|nr:helix-turn-helix transcriptional regulator [Phycicoccus sp.]
MQTVAVGGERLVETSHVRRAWDTLRGGHRALLLLGPVGAGKSSCLLHLAERRRRAGAKVATWPARAVPTNGLLIVDDAHLLTFAEVADLLRSAVTSGGEVVFAARPLVGWRDDFLAADLGIQVDVDALGTWDVGDISAIAGSQVTVEQLARLDIATVRHQTGGLPWLVSAALRDLAAEEERTGTSVVGEVVHAWQQLPEVEGELALALASGYGITEAPVAPGLQDLSTAQAVTLADQLLSAGLLEPAGGLPPLVRQTLLAEAPRHRVTALISGVLDELDELGSGFDRLPDEVLALGVRHPKLAEAALARGDEELALNPRRALHWYALAQASGDLNEVVHRRVQALGLLGDIQSALAELAPLPPTADLEVQGLASCLATLAGQHDQAASLWSTVGAAPLPDARTQARYRYAAAAAGNLGVLRDISAAESHLAAPLVPGAFEELASLVSHSLLTGSDALPGLVRLAQVGSAAPQAILYPDDRVAVAALVAVQSGDLNLAEAVLLGDGSERRAGRPAAQRIDCLRAWVAMAQGRYMQAQRLVDALDPRIGRDRIWILALRLGLARRQDDLAALTRMWGEARPTVIGLVPGLFDLLALGEIHLAAARMREPAVSRPVWQVAGAILDRLDQPLSFAPLFHWYGIQAAIASESPSDLVPHARALAALTGRSSFAATLAAAGRAWLGVLTGDADVNNVVEAAQGLGRKGLSWDGARLAAHGAARSTQARAPSVLLEVARDLQPRPEVPVKTSAGMPRQSPQHLGRVELSPREREVAVLVLQGLTYKEIGQRLYLSAKTIEHHMARIKRRSNASSRQELLARLSVTLSPD